MTELLERAAQARKAGLRSVKDRPSERRCSEFAGPLSASRAVTRHPIEVRDSKKGDGLDFTGYASVTEAPYEMFDFFGPYSEIVTGGAFDDTLKTTDLDVPLVLGHDSMRRIARTTNGTLLLNEDDTGLRSDAPNLDPADGDVAYIAPKLRSGLIDEMSFRFMIDAGQWSPDYTEFRINAVDIHRGDVSIVGYGASPHTSAQLRSMVDKLQNGQVLRSEEATVLCSVVDQAFGAMPKQIDPALDMAEELSELTQAVLRSREREIRRELHRRGMAPGMSLGDLLRVEV